MTAVARSLMAACFARCTDGSETSETGNGSEKDLSEKFGTRKLKATDSEGAKLCLLCYLLFRIFICAPTLPSFLVPSLIGVILSLPSVVLKVETGDPQFAIRVISEPFF